MLDKITPLLLTFNEAPNIGRTLEKLSWAKRIVIIDSFSTDETCDIARANSRVSLIQRPFDSFAAQCNFGLKYIDTSWALSLDADYILSDQLVDEIQRLSPTADDCAYEARFCYCIHGRPLRASLYPPRVVLYRKDRASYENEGHGHRVQVEGRISELNGVIFHDDRKPLDRWFYEQSRYASIEAEHLTRTASAELNFPDRIRKRIIFAPGLVFFYTLLIKGLILDGWPGWYYALQRTLAEALLSLRLMEQKWKRQ